MTRHISDDDLTLYYYGEGRYRTHRRWSRPRRLAEQHLETCDRCAAQYRELAGTLSMITAPEAPARGDQYGLEVWQRIRHQLPEQSGSWFARSFRWDRVALAGAAAVLALAAFVAGRTWGQPSGTAVSPRATTATMATTAAAAATTTTGAGADVRQRILLTSVADHLDRSERMLTYIMNAPDGDISTEQGWAEDLLTSSRLYRQDAVEAGEQSVAGVLDTLERSLIEIVHSPSRISASDLEQIRRRIDAAALLFKVRVMSDELRQREDAPEAGSRPRASTSHSS
jgi:hypothetical protein